MEAAFLNTTHAKMYIAINRLAIESCVIGKSNMYRRSDIDHLTALPSSRGQHKTRRLTDMGERERPLYPPEVVTGLPAFGEFLAEDNMIAASMMHELGLVHDMSCDVIVNALGPMSLYDYIQRRVRWIRVRKHMVFTATLLEPLTECLAVMLIGWYALSSMNDRVPFLAFALIHVGVWLTLDLGVYAAIAGHPLPPSERFSFVGAWMLRELMAFPIWLYGVVGSDVVWRGRTYTVRHNGKIRRREGDPTELWAASNGTVMRGRHLHEADGLEIIVNVYRLGNADVVPPVNKQSPTSSRSAEIQIAPLWLKSLFPLPNS